MPRALANADDAGPMSTVPKSPLLTTAIGMQVLACYCLFDFRAVCVKKELNLPYADVRGYRRQRLVSSTRRRAQNTVSDGLKLPCNTRL